MADSILHHEQHTHSYPYDWRTLQPCIYRASKQWFIKTEAIKQQAAVCRHRHHDMLTAVYVYFHHDCLGLSLCGHCLLLGEFERGKDATGQVHAAGAGDAEEPALLVHQPATLVGRAHPCVLPQTHQRCSSYQVWKYS